MCAQVSCSCRHRRRLVTATSAVVAFRHILRRFDRCCAHRLSAWYLLLYSKIKSPHDLEIEDDLQHHMSNATSSTLPTQQAVAHSCSKPTSLFRECRFPDLTTDPHRTFHVSHLRSLIPRSGRSASIRFPSSVPCSPKE